MSQKDGYAGWGILIDGIVKDKVPDSFVGNLASFMDMRIVRSYPECTICENGHIIMKFWSDTKFSLDIFCSERLDEKMVDQYVKNSLGVVKRSMHFVHRVWP